MKHEPGRILVWDIETTDLKADFGHMLMWAAKFVDEPELFVARIDETDGYGHTAESMIDDREIVVLLRDLVDSADAVVYHYGDRFDIRFLNTRCLQWGLRPPAKVSSIDTWRVARQNLAMTSNRLGTLADSYGNGKVKGQLSKRQWKLAAHGHKATLDAMEEYCVGDVEATEQLYLSLRPLIWNHPVLHVGDTICRTCGGNNLQGHGKRRLKHFIVHRYRCMDCGGTGEIRREKV